MSSDTQPAVGIRLKIVGRIPLRISLREVQPTRDADVEREARRLGRLYWTIRPLSEHNGTLDNLSERLQECRRWAKRNGVLDVLEETLQAHASEGQTAN